MYTKSDAVIWLIVFVIGLIFLHAGVNARKHERFKCAGNLSVSMAACAFAALALEVVVFFSKENHRLHRIISAAQLLVAGIWFLIFLIMVFRGDFGNLRKLNDN
jgi:hypothetical protein